MKTDSVEAFGCLMAFKLRQIMISFIARLSIFFLLLYATSVPSMVNAQTLVIRDEQFGIHVHAIAGGASWPASSFGYIRLWDSQTAWRDLEPEAGSWEFAVLDRYVDLATKHGSKVLLTLGQSPRWAAEDPNAKSPYGPGASSPPRSMSDWERYVQTVVLRYKGRVHAYEVWNEIDVPHFYVGTKAQLVALERATTKVVKATDPSALVLTASVQSGAYKHFDAYLSAGGGVAADVVSYHFYAPDSAPEVNVERMAEVRRLMAKHGLQAKPLWNTEMGWLIPNSDGGYAGGMRPAWLRWDKPDALSAAAYVARSLVLSLAGGASPVFWYAWDNGAMGLAEKRGTVPKPAALAFSEVQRWLVGSHLQGCNPQGAIWTCTLQRGPASCRMVWATKPMPFTVPSDWRATTWKPLLGGQTLPVPPGNVRLGGEPVLIC